MFQLSEYIIIEHRKYDIVSQKIIKLNTGNQLAFQ